MSTWYRLFVRLLSLSQRAVWAFADRAESWKCELERRAETLELRRATTDR